ncbi:MAG: proline--tRNA ligase [Mycoplasmoidaceae bacterium]
MKNKNIIARSQSFADWYTSVIKEAKLVEYGPVKGTMFFLPNGWAIWESIRNEIDKQFAKMGVRNIQLPLFIRQADFLKEKEHVEGFAPELFTVSTNKKGELAEPLVIRPTSEISFCQCFKSQIRSFNDLPLLYNQWCSVCRVEKNTRPFLRNTEFHWQELHTAHASKDEAVKQTLKTLEVYKNFVEDYLCMPVLVGEKTENERFAGAINTYTLEALMQDGQALQCATSHYLGQNFAKAYEVKYQTKDNKFDVIHQTSAGISTRIIGGLIMSHSDDNGIILPFKIAPIQIAIIVVNANDKTTTNYVKSLKKMLDDKYRVVVDDSDKSFGFKINKYQVQGVPFCLVVGAQEIEGNEVTFIRRDGNDKVKVSLKALTKHLTSTIKEYQANLFNSANNRLQSSIVEIEDFKEFTNAINNKRIALAYFDDTVANEKKLKEQTGATARCIKLAGVKNKKCFYTGKPATHLIYFARAY